MGVSVWENMWCKNNLKIFLFASIATSMPASLWNHWFIISALFMGFVQFAEVWSGVYSLCLQMCVCNLFWQQSTSFLLPAAALGREESDDPNPMHGTKGQQLSSENCSLLCTLAHVPADPKISEGPRQTSSHSTVLKKWSCSHFISMSSGT